MAKRNFNYGELTKGILTYFADTLTTGYSSIQGRKGANLPLLIDNLQELLKSIKNYQAKKIKVLRALKKLEKKEILDLQERDGKVVVYLKNENHPKIIEYSIKILLDFKKKNKQWNGKWFLVFNAQDKDSGIDNYKILENRKWKIENGNWEIAESPYLLKDQELKSRIYVKAVDKSGNERIAEVLPQNPPKWYENYLIFIIIILGAVIGYALIKKKNKNEK